jgi:hypothetical protein
VQHVIAIAAVIVIWPSHSSAQERLSFDERIAKAEQEFLGQDGLSKTGFSKQLGQLLEELDTTGGVSRETARQFWTSTLAPLFAEHTKTNVDSGSLIDQLVAAHGASSVHPLRWKIVRANLARRAAAYASVEAVRAKFDVGMENLNVLHQAEEELVHAEVAYYQSLLQTIPSTIDTTIDNVAKRILAERRLDAALNVYHSSLVRHKNISERLRMSMRGGTPQSQALTRVQVYRWQARVYELRLALDEL